MSSLRFSNAIARADAKSFVGDVLTGVSICLTCLCEAGLRLEILALRILAKRSFLPSLSDICLDFGVFGSSVLYGVSGPGGGGGGGGPPAGGGGGAVGAPRDGSEGGRSIFSRDGSGGGRGVLRTGGVVLEGGGGGALSDLDGGGGGAALDLDGGGGGAVLDFDDMDWGAVLLGGGGGAIPLLAGGGGAGPLLSGRAGGGPALNLDTGLFSYHLIFIIVVFNINVFIITMIINEIYLGLVAL